MKINFEVGAKAARLIGRENIADVDGALSELIKNAYDADASCVYVNFKIPFPDVPSQTEANRFSDILSAEDYKKICTFYHNKQGILIRNDDLSESQKAEIENILFRYDYIIIADNGEGMNRNIVSSSWMQIATSNKETNIKTKKGRTKTGAKGIGRFALDKLSRHSIMYTQTSETPALRWEINWDQFASARLLKDVQAELDDLSLNLTQILVENIDEAEFKRIEHYGWKSGTIIILSPIREAWNRRLFSKVNTNLKSINPFGSVDKFDVFVNNEYYPEFTYHTEDVSISETDYDYKIDISYDGHDLIDVNIFRNEFDTHKKNTTFEIGDYSEKFLLKGFWTRDAFSHQPYRPQDYEEGIRKLHLNVNEFLDAENKDKIYAIGKFSAELYFVKSGKSDFAIVKDVPVRSRKALLSHFSGIKLYRDNFKVRPYGDEGSLFDWLQLDERVNRSPGGVASSGGQWHVRSYQMLGIVKIGRVDNPMLYDMANREGLTQNESYFYFIRILQEAISRFEYDRQYVYREYSKWKKQCEHSMTPAADLVKNDVRERGILVNSVGEGKTFWQSNDMPLSNNDASGENPFSERDYRETVATMLSEADKELKAKQTLEALSSAGVILNTFFHEFRAITTNFKTRGSQMKARINYLLGGKDYTGIPFYNPYKKLEEYDRVDKVLAAWLKVVMQAISKDSLEKKTISLHEETNKIVATWKLLLEEKYIKIDVEPKEEPIPPCQYNLAIVDLYVILNNFILNSVWFLEHADQDSREIQITLTENSSSILLSMKNNGPKLDEKFKEQPQVIFEIGKSSKPKGTGTGIGLWLMKEATERNDGQISLMEGSAGFGINIEWKKAVPLINPHVKGEQELK